MLLVILCIYFLNQDVSFHTYTVNVQCNHAETIDAVGSVAIYGDTLFVANKHVVGKDVFLKLDRSLRGNIYICQRSILVVRENYIYWITKHDTYKMLRHTQEK